MILVSNVALNALPVMESPIIVILVGLDFIHFPMHLNALSAHNNVLHVIVLKGVLLVLVVSKLLVISVESVVRKIVVIVT